MVILRFCDKKFDIIRNISVKSTLILILLLLVNNTKKLPLLHPESRCVHPENKLVHLHFDWTKQVENQALVVLDRR